MRRKTATIVASVCFLVAGLTALAMSKEVPRPSHGPEDSPARRLSLDRGRLVEPLHATTVPETTVFGYWTFDDGAGSCDSQGWTSNDRTFWHDAYWHVDDFAGLGGGDFGRLVALEGIQSMWCGARPDTLDPVLCQYNALPGYGNSWDQHFSTVACLSVTGDVTVDYLLAWDSEPNYDATALEYDLCDDNWIRFAGGLGVYDDVGSGFFTSVVDDTSHLGQVRLRFRFTSDGGWSDEDGLMPSDGAAILDSLTVTDATGILLPTELFETETVGDGATASGNWEASVIEPYGDFAGLYNGIHVVQEDPCVSNLTCLWGFFNGSTADYSCGGYAEQKVVPYGNERGQYIFNSIWSPWLPITGSGESFVLEFDVYRDLPNNAVVYYSWAVRSLVDGCPGWWRDRGSGIYSGPDKEWYRVRTPFGDLIDAGATHVQIELSVEDWCAVWCGSIGTGECHSHAPLYDNVAVYRVASRGPLFTLRDTDLFQDNFASDGTTTGTVRADMARDVDYWGPNVRPGDSTLVLVSDPDNGLAIDPYTGYGAAVYGYVSVRPAGQAGKGGGALTQDNFNYPVVDSLVHNGEKWYCLRADSAGNLYSGFCLDLNDNLFTPGDTVRFVFAATSAAPSNVTRFTTLVTGDTDDLAYALDNAMEFTCLPTGNASILYVDGYDGLGAQPLFDTAFDILGLTDFVDRYDVRHYYGSVSNGPGSRVVDVPQQLLSMYKTIIWNSGDRDENTIGDGDLGSNDSKSDDFAMLVEFLDGLTVPGGLYLSGDDLAEEWDGSIASSAAALRAYMSYTLLDGDHQNFGQPLSPYVIGEPGGCLAGDTLVAYGGCPTINDFDVLGAGIGASVEASYSTSLSGAGAVVAQQTTNPESTLVGVVLSGFSFHEIRDADVGGTPARAEHLRKILQWLGNTVPLPTDVRPVPWVNSLAQNYPNPFNPTTTVEFTVKERARVRLSIYNVRGQLVKTLVDDERAPGVVHKIVWKGDNNAGQSVASGVYFYRLVTKGYTQTKKMVLLK